MRGTGRTTAQIANAPDGAIFVWCTNNTRYAQELVKKLLRTDMKIVSPSWLRIENIIGRRGLSVVVDHALDMDKSQREAFLHIPKSFVLDFSGGDE